MPAGNYDITIEQGATFELTLVLRTKTNEPYNLTGFTGSAQLRTRHAAIDPAATFTVTIPSPATSGTIKLALSAQVTAALPVKNMVYDVEVANSDGYVLRVLQGVAVVSPEVTR